jgi:hypothetical protein
MVAQDFVQKQTDAAGSRCKCPSLTALTGVSEFNKNFPSRTVPFEITRDVETTLTSGWVILSLRGMLSVLFLGFTPRIIIVGTHVSASRMDRR